mmetsp:Transcript_31668/g.73444  ORF Transcript_31668/g.73444 Transcript_31668/m.73444 type:complete len:168 (-) Transcript_31668:188-691(-)
MVVAVCLQKAAPHTLECCPILALAMIYNFYIFGRGNKCLCREDWNRTRVCADVAEEVRLMSGLLLTLKSFAKQIGASKNPGFVAYATPQYKLHSLETTSGYRFVLTTDPGVPNQQECLRHIYAELFVEHVVKNPMYAIGEDVSLCTSFISKLHGYVQTRPFFATIAT